MDTVTVGPNRIAYRVAGSGLPLLLLHGWPFSHTSYDALVNRLAPHFTCYRPDTPGLGATQWSEATDFSFGAQARSLRGFADALGLQRYALLGHDTGATIARLLAAEDGRVASLVLLNTEMPGHRPPWIPLYRHLAALPGRRAVFPLLLRSRRYLRSPLGFGGCFADPACIDQAFVARVIAPLLASPQRLDGMLRYLRGIDWRVVDGLEALHAKLSMPVQLIWGADDPTFPVALARRMASQFPHASMAEIPAARLLVHEERPQAVADVALRFLDGVAG
ncbi:MAG: alpha/beta hydrolase [bacterium]